MRLEILREPARGSRSGLSVLFLHGICCSADVWRPDFLEAFAARGHEAAALSFRGHGRSGGRQALAWTTLKDYADDLDSALETLEGPVAIVGHSMGGAVLQEHLRRGGRPSAAVLMNTVPPYGLAHASMRLLLNAPGAWGSLAMANAFGFGVVSHQAMRDLLAGPRVDQKRFRDFLAAAGDESPLVGFELQGWRPFAPEPWRAPGLPPILTLGGAEDRLVSLTDLYATAAYYGSRPIALSGMGHVPMIEPDWRRAAEPVLDWLDRAVLGLERAA